MGLSPCDILLYDIDIKSVREAILALNNRFDSKYLSKIKAEFFYVFDILSNNLIFDYESREDRILSKKLNVAKMTTFGESNPSDNYEIIRKLEKAKKVFTGKVKVKNNIVAVKSEKTKEILELLYNKRQLIYDIAEMINGGNFRDDMFFGKPVIWWINIKSHYWLTSLVETRIKTQDNIDRLIVDAKKMLNYMKDDDTTYFLQENEDISFSILRNQYIQMTGVELREEQRVLCDTFCEKINSLKANNLLENTMLSISRLFLYCFIASDNYDEEVAEELNMIGLYFMNSVKAEMMLKLLSDYSLIPERKIVLQDFSSGDSYKTILNAICALSYNDKTPVGAILEEEI
jgi:hypothetical protein